MKHHTESMGRHPICGLVAMSLVSKTSLGESIEAYQNACRDLTGKKMQGNWKGATYGKIREHALKNYFGVNLNHIKEGKGKALKTFAANALPNTLYMVVTTGHVQVLLNGHVVDQRGIVPIDEYWGRRKKIRQVMVIDK